ncbi:MAG: cupredoxin domain-containing protein [Rhizomicrobium sp.]
MIPRLMKHALIAASLFAVPLPAFAAAPDIVMKNFDFTPMTLTVKAGATVTWKNADGEPHTVVSADGLFRSAALDENDTFQFVFAKPGTYKYVCSIHPKMVGTIAVK